MSGEPLQFSVLHDLLERSKRLALIEL